MPTDCPKCNSVNVVEDPDNLDPNLINQDPDKPLKCEDCLHRFGPGRELEAKGHLINLEGDEPR